MNREAAFARAHRKFKMLVGGGIDEELISFPPAPRPEYRGCAHVIDGRQPVREINGAVLADQRPRWKPEPPTYTAADLARAKQQQEADARARAEDQRFWASMREAAARTVNWPNFKMPKWERYEKGVPYPKGATSSEQYSKRREEDRADAFTFLFERAGRHAARADKSEAHKEALRRLIATFPVGSKQRADAELLLRRIEANGG